MPTDQPSLFALPGGSLELFIEARGDTGMVRTVNEDSLLAAPPVFLVADGMGGHAKGEAASRAVAQVFAEHIAPGALTTPEQVLDAIHSANDAVRDLSTVGDSGAAVAGTTLTGIALVDGGGDGEGEGAGAYRWMVFNVGDSRVYGWDGRVLRQQSVDHSAVQEMIDAGLISVEDAEQHPERNVITRALGADDSVDVDVWLNQPAEYGTYLVCSDGLSKELDRSEISAIFARHEARGDFSGIADELVDAALDAGGRDNVSVIVVRAATP